MEGDKERGVKDNGNYGKTSTQCISLCLSRNYKIAENTYELFKFFFLLRRTLLKIIVYHKIEFVL